MSEKAHSLSPPAGSSESVVTDLRYVIRDVPGKEREDLEREAVRRMDYTLLPFLTVLFLLAFLDRASSGKAEVYGLQQDLKLTDAQYRICITVLFVPYTTTELPSSLLLREMGANIFIPTFVTFWGVALVLLGLVTSFAGVSTVKAFLGAFMWPMAPAIVCYLSGFYTRKELSSRIALMFSVSSLSASLTGLLSTAIQGMKGIGGKPSWAWLFIIGGLFTIGNGVAGFFLIPATPKDSKFLTSQQKDLIMARLKQDRPSIVPFDKFSLGEVFRGFSPPHVFLLSVLLFMVGTAQFGLTLTLPSIVNELGFNGIKAQLLGTGPFVLGFLATLKSGSLSDRYQSRGIVTALIAAMAITGYLILFATNNKYVAYGSLYLIVPGIYAPTPPLFAWLSNNTEPHYRRVSAIASGFIAANSGCVLSTWVFSPKDGPKYRKTAIVNLIFSICIVLVSLLNVAYLSWKNKSKTRLGRREVLLQKYSEDEDGGLRAWMELGDEHPDFLYTL